MCRRKKENPLFSPKGAGGSSPELSRPPEGPEKYQVKLATSIGDVVIDVEREWSPNGANRFYELVKAGYYDQCRFFRVIPGFMVQTGISGNPKTSINWKDKNIYDDPVKHPNKPGYVSFAMAGPNTRTTQFFINYGDNSGSLDPQGFSPFGKVTEGMAIVEKIYSGYGEQPEQGAIHAQGNDYLNANFSKLDYIKRATIISENGQEVTQAESSKAEPSNNKSEKQEPVKAPKPTGEN